MRGSCHSCGDQSHPLPSAGLLKVMQGRGLVRATLPWESGPILGAGRGRRYQESHPRPRQGFLGSAPCFRGRRHSLDSACGQGWERGLGVRRGAQCRPRIGSSPSASLSTGCQVPRFHSRLSGLRSQPGCRGSVHRYEGLRWVPGHWEWGRKKSRRIRWGWGVSPRGGRGGGEKMRCTHSLCFASSCYCFSQFNNEIFQTHKRGLKNNRGFTHQPTTQLGK